MLPAGNVHQLCRARIQHLLLCSTSSLLPQRWCEWLRCCRVQAQSWFLWLCLGESSSMLAAENWFLCTYMYWGMVRKAWFLLGQVAFLSPTGFPAITRLFFMAESDWCWQTSLGGCDGNLCSFLCWYHQCGCSPTACPQGNYSQHWCICVFWACSCSPALAPQWEGSGMEGLFCLLIS